jgi:hypothetical protein
MSKDNRNKRPRQKLDPRGGRTLPGQNPRSSQPARPATVKQKPARQRTASASPGVRVFVEGQGWTTLL